MKRNLVFFLGVFLFPCFLFAAETRITAVAGKADVKYAQQDAWYQARTGDRVGVGQTIKTKARSRVQVELADGSKIEVLPNSQVNLHNLNSKSPTIKVALGRLKAWVSKNARRSKFEVHTPVAVCSVRGTEFTVGFDEQGQSTIEVDEGLVGVRRLDGLGEEVPVGAGEKLDIRRDGALYRDQKSDIFGAEKAVRREVGLEMSKEEVQTAAAAELRLAEYQEGKTMVDVYGQRVRLEEYIIRMASTDPMIKDTFKLVLLNERENRFDYFYYKGQFNKELPTDLSTALKDLGGKIGDTRPEYYLKAYEKGYSNTLDYIKDTAGDGHQVKVTYDGTTYTLVDADDPSNNRQIAAVDATNGAYDPLADTFDAGNTATAADVSLFNPASDTFEDFTAGQTLWVNRFDSYQHEIDGIRKQWYLPSSARILAADLDGHWITPALDSSGNTIWGEWSAASTVSRPDTSLLHDDITLTYKDGTFERYNNYIIDDNGEIAPLSSFSGVTSGSQYKQELLKWNYEQVITASEFGGRKIDLVIEPKILIKSGILE
jgi:hypothetical protein